MMCLSLFIQVSYEDFKIHMARMYQQYERQQVHHISDPALRQQHPVSTISGITQESTATGTGQTQARITELRETNDQGTQIETEASVHIKTADDISEIPRSDDPEGSGDGGEKNEGQQGSDPYEVLGFEQGVKDFIKQIVDEVVARVEENAASQPPVKSLEPQEATETQNDVSNDAQVSTEGESRQSESDIPEGEQESSLEVEAGIGRAAPDCPSEPQSRAEAEAAEKEAHLTGIYGHHTLTH